MIRRAHMWHEQAAHARTGHADAATSPAPLHAPRARPDRFLTRLVQRRPRA